MVCLKHCPLFNILIRKNNPTIELRTQTDQLIALLTSLYAAPLTIGSLRSNQGFQIDGENNNHYFAFQAGSTVGMAPGIYMYGGDFTGWNQDNRRGDIRLYTVETINSPDGITTPGRLIRRKYQYDRTAGTATLIAEVFEDFPSGQFMLTPQSAPPTPVGAGHIYLDDGTNTGTGTPAFRMYDGTAWVDL